MKIRPSRVRYLKLGRGGRWEKECLQKGIARFGFGTSKPERYLLCRSSRWEELAASFVAEGRDAGTATRFANETKLFFEDEGSILWITFIGEKLCWGFLSAELPQPHSDNDGVYRKLVDGWRHTDLNGEELTKDRLPGSLTKISSYRGTSCDLDVSEYVVRRINGQKTPEVERAVAMLVETRLATLEIIRLLDPRDFEILVDLVFSTSGWRRNGIVGKTQKTLDLDLTLPSTGERAFVQVKSKTTSMELNEYLERMKDADFYNRMFYVYHSGEAQTEDERVTVVGPDKLAELVINAGLVNWVIQKVS